MRPLALVGDAGHGKTTTARFIARWWLAETTHHVHVYAGSPEEWGNRAFGCTGLIQPVTTPWTGCGRSGCLVVVDDLDQAPAGALQLLPLGHTPMVLTSGGGGLDELDQIVGEYQCLALLGPVERPAAEARAAQGRLDWPLDAVPVVPDRRGGVDFPRHRWHRATASLTGPAANGGPR